MGKPHNINLILSISALTVAVLACNLPATQTESPPEGTSIPMATDVVSETEVPATAVPATITPSPVIAVPDTPTASLTPSVEAAEVPEEDTLDLENAEVIYQTDFSAGWPDVETDHSNSESTDGGYSIIVDEDWAHWVYTTRARVSTFYAEVTANVEQCGDDSGGYGIIFHYEDETNFRVFYVTCNGNFVVQERVDGSDSTLLRGTTEQGQLNEGQHQIGVYSIDDEDQTVRFYVDETPIGEITVTEQAEGDIGPYVTAASEGMSVVFTRLVVYQP